MIITHGQIIELVWLIFRMMLIYKVIATVCVVIVRIPDFYKMCECKKREIEARKREVAKVEGMAEEHKIRGF